MSTPEIEPDGKAASLAAALIARMGPLAQAAAHAKDGIAADRDRFAGEGEADALIDTVIERVDGLEADCRRLMKILGGFEAAATSEPEPVAEAATGAAVPEPGAPSETDVEPEVKAEPAPAVAVEREVEASEPTPAEEAAGITTFPGAASVEPEPTAVAEPDLAVEPPRGAPISAEPPPGVEPPSGDPVAAAPPPTGEPIIAEAVPADAETESAEADVGANQAAVTPDASPDSDEPVHVSEGVRLLATQMSVAGASMDDIARRLHNDFGVENADRLISQLFGSGSQSPR